MNTKAIYYGFKNSLVKNENTEVKAQKRLNICKNCPYRNGNRCGLCGCFLVAKARQDIEICKIWEKYNLK